MADIMAEAVHEPLSLLSSESSFISATPPTDASSTVASSLSSTPPTSASPDTLSLASEQDIAKIMTATTPMPEESQLAQPSSALQHATIQSEHVLEQQPEQRSEQQMQSQPEDVGDLHAGELSDLDAQLQREAEAQHLAEPDMDVDEHTPAASAIVVALKKQKKTDSPTATPDRPRRARASLPVYNVSKLFGIIRDRRRAEGDDVRVKPKRRVSAADALTDNAAGAPSTDNIANVPVANEVDAPAILQGAKIGKNKTGTRKETRQELLTRRATRLSSTPAPSKVTGALTSIGRSGKKAAEDGLLRITRELRRLQDTKEFAHVDDRPIIETVWSKGKFVDPRTLSRPGAESRASKRVKTTHNTEVEHELKSKAAVVSDAPVALAPVEEVPQKKRTSKKWLDKGLYAGQDTPKDILVGLTKAEKKRLAKYPELLVVRKQPNTVLPPPMFNGLRLLLQGRDFKLPFDVCNPLPPGHPKPPAYRTMTKNRFVGDASAYWKKQPHLDDFQSKCVCKPLDGCGSDCQNRIMLYECDDTNCNIGKDHCSNRAFQSLQERTKQGGRFRVGVEVFKTAGKGYGVRSNRCFRPNQIIMEYTGEIITNDECKDRMETKYKNNECYYLMSFDQNMIIDATTGSAARFVNHSCSPNCRMIKWIVGGQPRMALFAGDRPIMTGEELTYDYNFDPFSAKSVQKCLCGAENCRGILGPKPREVKALKAVVPSKDETKKAGKAGKRKYQELVDNEDKDVKKASSTSVKKRKMAIATGAASSLSKSGLKAAKGAATALKRSMSSISVSAKAALSSKAKSSPLRRVSTGGILKKSSPGKATPAKKAKITTTKAAISALISSGTLSAKKAPATKQTSRSSSASLTIVAAPPKIKTKALSTTTGNVKSKYKPALKLKTPNKRTPPKKGKAQQHSGYTPPSSPGPSARLEPLKLSARKKVPTRKILESKVAGTASVTKPNAKPKAKGKSKIAAVAKRSGFMAAIRKAAKSVAPAPAAAEEKEKDVSPAAEGSIEAAPPRFRKAPVAAGDSDADVTPPLPESSPERQPREAMDVPRVASQIRLVESQPQAAAAVEG